MLVIWLKKQTMTQKVQKLKINLIIMINKYITTAEFNTLAADVFNARLGKANLVTKANCDNTVSSLDSKIAANRTKSESIENELKLKIFDSSYFIGKIHFEEDGTPNLFSISTAK